MWLESARLAECHIIGDVFNQRTQSAGITVYCRSPTFAPFTIFIINTAFEVLPTYMVSLSDISWTVQPYVGGTAMHSHLFSTTKDQELFTETMQAFTHFTYEHTEHRMVHTDFQGKLS